VNKAFVLGAGLGERLRPLTDQLPKPLIPVFQKPLITYAFDHLLAAGVREFVVNTHHIPEAYARAFPDQTYRGVPIRFRNEAPVRLETAGGIANVRDLIGDEPFIVYNGDILTDLPLAPLIQEHRTRGNMVTLALRSSGPAQHIALDRRTGLITDIRGKLGTGNEGEFLFTGIYVVEPEFFEWLTPGKVESVIPIFLAMIQKGARLGGVVLDGGHWWDLGSRSSYLDAHHALNQLNSHFPNYAALDARKRAAIDPAAKISNEAKLSGVNIIGAQSVIGSGAELNDCIVWPGAHVSTGARLSRCIVRSGIEVTGSHTERDF
jgi:mannose-1-phosphate guanylyltransferase